MNKGLPKPAAIALVLVGLAVVAAAGYFLLVSPQRSKSAELDEEIAAVETQIRGTRIARQQAREVEPVRVADLFRLAKAMPDTDDMPGVLLELNKIARDTGIRFESIAPKDGVDAGGYLRQPIELVFDGNFYELSDFLYRMRTLVSVHSGELSATGRLFTVRSLGFVESERGFPRIKASLAVDAFVYGAGTPSPATQPPAGAAPPPAPVPPPSPTSPPPPGASAVGAP